jgi:putative endonuclease
MQHHQKMYPACFTATRLPVQLVFSQEFVTREEALASERRIKGWSRKKKEALIKGDWETLSISAKRQKVFD